MLIRRSRLRATASVLLAIGMSLAVLRSASAEQTPVHVLVAFNESAGETPEGIAVDHRGNLFVSVSPLGDLWKIPAGSSSPQPFGHIDGITPGTDFGMLGLAVDHAGNVYAGVQSANPAAAGVWRFDRQSGAATRLPGTAAIGIPNGLAFDRRMNLFVTDSTGAIWRIPWGGRASIWLRDDALTGDGSLGLFLGANGIAIRKRVLTVTNTERRTVLHIPNDGRFPGQIREVTSLPAGENPDGVALDVHGNAFIALNLANSIARVTPHGSTSIVASGAPLDFPSSLVFGRGRAGPHRLYGVSFSIGEGFGLPPGSGPCVFWLH
jgi:sugar lactone lactonase YvrE